MGLTIERGVKVTTKNENGLAICERCNLPIRKWGEVHVKDARTGETERIICKPCNADEQHEAWRESVQPIERETHVLQEKIEKMLSAEGDVDQTEFLKVANGLLSLLQVILRGEWR